MVTLAQAPHGLLTTAAAEFLDLAGSQAMG
jgi:hypothetical protein